MVGGAGVSLKESTVGYFKIPYRISYHPEICRDDRTTIYGSVKDSSEPVPEATDDGISLQEQEGG